MTPEQLKASVLQYAMQGKLVPQDSTDEPASELIKRIQAEKKQLFQEKKIKKEKPLPEISEEEKPFDIPESWEWVRLGEVSEYIQRGKSPKYVEKSNYPVISQKCVQWNEFTVEPARFIDESTIEKYEGYRFLRESDLLWNSTGTGTVGRINIIKKNDLRKFKKLVVDTHVTIVRTFLEINSEYILNYLKAPVIQESMHKLTSGTTKQKELNLKTIINIPIPLPSLKEQQRIVQRVEELFEKIDEYAESYNRLEELNKQFPIRMEKSLLQYAMQGKLVPQDQSDESASELLKQIKAEKEQLIQEKKIKKEKPLPEITQEEIPFEIPESWEWVRLGSIAEKIQYGYTASAMENGNVKFVRITDIHNNKVNWDSVPYCNIEKIKLNGLKLSKGDILIARTGGTIGKSFLVPKIDYEAVFASYLIRIKPVNNKLSKYIQLYLNSPLYWNLLAGISFGTGQPNVNATNLSLLVIPIPPLNEQCRTLLKVHKIFDIIRKLNK